MTLISFPRGSHKYILVGTKETGQESVCRAVPIHATQLGLGHVYMYRCTF